MVPGEVFQQAPKRLICITIHRLKIAETINSTITILGKCWTLPDGRKLTLRDSPICTKFEYGSNNSRPRDRGHFHCCHG